MKNFIYSLILSLTMMMSMSSCVCAQTYTRVYYDHVITGVVNTPGYINDGYYSYHIVGDIPMNMYWELWPCGDVALYNRSMVFQRWYYPSNYWVFYNHHRHHRFTPPRPPHRPHNYGRPPHRPPHNGYRPPRDNGHTRGHRTPPPPRHNRGRN